MLEFTRVILVKVGSVPGCYQLIGKTENLIFESTCMLLLAKKFTHCHF